MWIKFSIGCALGKDGESDPPVALVRHLVMIDDRSRVVDADGAAGRLLCGQRRLPRLVDVLRRKPDGVIEIDNGPLADAEQTTPR